MSEVPPRALLDDDEYDRLEVIARARGVTAEILAAEYVADGVAREFSRHQRASEAQQVH